MNTLKAIASAEGYQVNALLATRKVGEGLYPALLVSHIIKTTNLLPPFVSSGHHKKYFYISSRLYCSFPATCH